MRKSMNAWNFFKVLQTKKQVQILSFIIIRQKLRRVLKQKHNNNHPLQKKMTRAQNRQRLKQCMKSKWTYRRSNMRISSSHLNKACQRRLRTCKKCLPEQVESICFLCISMRSWTRSLSCIILSQTSILRIENKSCRSFKQNAIKWQTNMEDLIKNSLKKEREVMISK